MAVKYLYITGLVIYILNYSIGWLLYFRIISMKKRTHQVIYSLIIINLLVLIAFIQFFSTRFFILLASLFFMLILPSGRKGGMFHRIVSTAGLVCYIGAL